MNTNESNDPSKISSRQEILLESTISYLFSFAPELTDAIFRSAILRWFNPEVLEAVLGAGTISNIQASAAGTQLTPQELYQQLCGLPFAEEYPGRGYSFHDLTRELILSYLWKKELDYYAKVSDQATQHFTRLLNAQIEQSKRGEIDPGEVDWNLGVELVYHSVVANEPEAIDTIGNFLDSLLQQPRLGTYHAVIQAISEHAEAGRLAPDSQAWLKIWRINEALANYDLAGLERMASEILQAPDTSAPPWLKAEATFLLADGLYRASRYDEAERYLKQNIDQCKDLDDDNSLLRAILELGRVELYRENYEQAGNHFADALYLHVQQMRIPLEKELTFFQKFLRILLRVLRPFFFWNKARRFLKTSLGFGNDTPLLIFSPEAWHRRELVPTDTQPDQPEPSVKSDAQEQGSQEETSQVIVLYFIEIDTQKLGFDTTGLSEEKALEYEQPIQFDDVLAELWLNFGYLYNALDQYDLAAVCGRLATQMYVDLENLSGTQAAVQFLRSLGVSLYDLEYIKTMGEFQSELLSTAVARKDQRAIVSGLINQASSQFEKNEYEEAQATYAEAYALAESLALPNEKATCLDGLAKLSWYNADYDTSIVNFRLALDLYEQIHNREGWADSMLSLGELHLARNQFIEADDCFRRALDTFVELQAFSGRFNSLLRLSDMAKNRGDYEGSFTLLDQALQLSRLPKVKRLHPEAVALSNIARLHLSLGHLDQAQDAFNQAIGIAERIGNKQLSVNILLDKADLLTDMAEYASTVQVCDQIIKADPQNAPAYSKRGWALKYQGKKESLEAITAYEKASEFLPNDWWIQSEIAEAMRKSGDKSSSMAKYQSVIKQIEEKGRQPVFNPSLAWCYYQLGEYEKARDLFTEVVKSDPDPISDYFDLGLVLLCCKQYPEALKAYELAIPILQGKCPPLRRLGLIYVAIDDLKDAIEVHPELLDVEEYHRIKELLIEQQNLARSNPEGKPKGN
jgi:tetratricopeptide (TPR) repeat protein